MTGAAAGARGCGSRPIEVRRIDWWATAVQLLGTLFFNVTTFTALDAHLTAKQSDLVVWTPDALGSICFLVASQLAYAEAGRLGIVASVGRRLADRSAEYAGLDPLRHIGDRGMGAAVHRRSAGRRPRHLGDVLGRSLLLRRRGAAAARRQRRPRV
jgi:hypothetical protein